jgi:D-3-phosphoglycerate dehydrogenase
MALALIRRVPFLDRHVRDGGWSFEAAGTAGLPGELTLGIIGLGRIGRRLASLGRGLFARIVGHDPLVTADRWPPAVERVELDECLRASHVVSLHLPLTEETQRLIDRRALALMPSGSMLVNVSRGGLVDEDALMEALDRGQLAGAALDVTDPEPPDVGGRIRNHPRILLTPHAAFYSAQTPDRYVVRQAENVVAWKLHGRPLNPVNEPEPIDR